MVLSCGKKGRDENGGKGGWHEMWSARGKDKRVGDSVVMNGVEGE